MARFLQLTDLHVVAPGILASGVLDTRTILTKAIDRLLTLLPSFRPLDAVLVTGDISDDGSPGSYTHARAELERLGLPLLVIPGNHDAREALRSEFAGLDEMPATGLIDWTTTVAGTQVIGLDTLVEGQGGGRLRPESLALLESALAASDGQPVIVALHHPPFSTGIKFMDAIGLENSDELASTVSGAAGEILFAAGHVHGVHHGRLGRHRVATAPSLCSAFALDLREKAPVGFMSGPTGCAVIDTSPNGIWTAVPLDPADGPFRF